MLVPWCQIVLDDNVRYRLLTLLDENPELTQRELANKMGISLGKTNYCLKALIDKGMVKVQNFRNSENKIAYLYKLTPAGMNDKIRVTRRFLVRKVQEHAELSIEIERLKSEMESHSSPHSRNPLDHH
jgi:EPS-associated MarR family transcriptional regulator